MSDAGFLLGVGQAIVADLSFHHDASESFRKAMANTLSVTELKYST
ncbi:MAG: hypothetical protein M1356_08895 [Gammaproteobacteria bacterium]|nr:hypothetical protein [Gammaproteobacteria bacterium]